MLPYICSGRPTPYRPEMLNDLRLDVSPTDPLVKIYRVALWELIREMKRRKIGHQQFILEDGELVNSEGSGFSYQFEFAEDANLFGAAGIAGGNYAGLKLSLPRKKRTRVRKFLKAGRPRAACLRL